MTLGRRWLEGAVSRVTGPTTARCAKTGNPCGTDTWMAGQSCPCKPCQAWLDAHPEAREVRLPDPYAPWKPDPPDSNDDVLEQLRKVTTGGST